MSALGCWMRVAIAAGLVLCVACGPKAAPPPTSRPTPAGPVEPTRPQAPPPPPFEVKAVRAFASPTRCSQGPLELEVAALGAAPAERLVVEVCTPRAVGGRYHLQTTWYGQMGSFGVGHPDNARCAATESERTAVRAVPAPAPPATKGKKSARRGGGKAAPAAPRREAAPRPTEVPWPAGHTCARTVPVLDHTFGVTSGRPLGAGTPLRIRLWSAVPNDLEGARFVVKQLGLASSVTEAQWREHQRRVEQYERELRAWIDKLPTCGTPAAAHRTCANRDPEPARALRPDRPPPPPRTEKRPPRPSVNAEWVPGYWHWGAATWGWISGWWRVPTRDVAEARTARAPAAPPAPKAEQPAARPAASAVWVPGHWMWSAPGWVWVGGTWRLPPGPGYRWRAPEWRRVPSGAVFIPGDWVR